MSRGNSMVAAFLVCVIPVAAGAGRPGLALAPSRGALLHDGTAMVLVAEGYVEPRTSAARLSVVQVMTLDALGRATRVRTVQGEALVGAVTVLTPALGRAEPGVLDIAAGGRAILWLPHLVFREDEVPRSIYVTVGLIENGRPVYETAALALDAADVSRTLRFPVRGEWIAVNGPGGDSPHRRAALLQGEEWLIGQRHALDLMKLAPTPSGAVVMHTGTGQRNADYACFGEPVFAPAAGRVVTVRDGMEDHAPTQLPTTAQPAGNQVVLSHGDGRYSVFAHLKMGSLRVKAGQRVREGDELGLVGNSGHSTAPHLHYQLCDRPDVLRSQGLPASFRSVRVRRLGSRLLQGVTPVEGDLVEGH